MTAAHDLTSLFGVSLCYSEIDAHDANDKWENWTPFSYPFNLTQQPAASVPCGFTKAGLPAGLHVVGRMFDDRTVLRVCAAFEAATEFHKMRAMVGVVTAKTR